MQQTRRQFLRTSLASSTIVMALGAGLLKPKQLLAAWPSNAFHAQQVGDAIKALLGEQKVHDSDAIQIKVPDIAENGAVVSFTVTSKLANTEQVSILVPENAAPLCASYLVTDNIDSVISGRIKMRQTSDVMAVVKANGKLLTAKKSVKVTLGGCGG